MLALLLGPPHARLVLERHREIDLQREAPDRNRNRMLLLERSKSGVLQHELVSAWQITDERPIHELYPESSLERMVHPLGRKQLRRLRHCDSRSSRQDRRSTSSD